MPLDFLFNKLLFRLFSYLNYFFSAQSNHYLHSPFIFNWYSALYKPLSAGDKARVEEYALLVQSQGGNLRLNAQNQEVSIKKRFVQTKISHRGGLILHNTANSLGSATVLELGTSLGMSALYLASSKEVKKLISIDRESPSLELVQTLFPSELSEKAQWVVGDFRAVLANQLQNSPKIDLVYIDGDHSYRGVIDYTDQITPFLNESSCIIYDDIRWSRDMYRAWQEVSKREEFLFSVDLGRFGLLFKRPNLGEKQDFTLK